jgi:uncharacterized SAM-binding protein YcdF (DUF218 family)
LAYALSKIIWAIICPSTLLVLALLTGVVMLLLHARSFRMGLILVTASAFGFGACTFLPLGNWLLRPLENRFPAVSAIQGPVDGIILLGGAIDMPISVDRGRPVLNMRANRIVEFAAIARRFPSARLLLSGGNASLVLSRGTEAEEMREILEELSISPNRLILETRSRNTHENALFSRDQLRPTPHQRWLLVTSAADMPRAIGCFRAAGWLVTAVPVDYHTRNAAGSWAPELPGSLKAVDWAAHEWIGLLYYYLRGWSPSLFPGPTS